MEAEPSKLLLYNFVFSDVRLLLNVYMKKLNSSIICVCMSADAINLL